MTETNTTNKAYETFKSTSLNDEQIQQVEKIKYHAAMLWDKIDDINYGLPGSVLVSAECTRLIALAKTSLEESIMWANKAISRQ